MNETEQQQRRLLVKPDVPPPLTTPSHALPKTFTVAARPADFPPWPLYEGPGPLTKSMVLSMRAELREAQSVV